ncbi:DNA topoisomerase II [Heterostelium album PN500]|uniref:DNA topoisomerase 2 n=1 Tax=Heterostelium pallidum (strain ATCC 26659 / Pp 5 / PN500) TaxID=670386 RepID=D3BML1_HETP5|nr:DNA topoisomerase II [Heterostelium album PN500]EFA77223.1 DNA topoisomerase II [Heterostelium album PN500]|eukprot:XP_020429352.1 DNA topoisomerase II [Heterostelium album PN500]
MVSRFIHKSTIVSGCTRGGSSTTIISSPSNQLCKLLNLNINNNSIILSTTTILNNDNNNSNQIRHYSSTTSQKSGGGGTTASNTKVAKSKSIEDVYQKKTPTEHVLLRPDSYIGTIQTIEDDMWMLSKSIFGSTKNDSQSTSSKKLKSTDSTATVATVDPLYIHSVKAKYIPGLLKIFDEILVNAADNKQRDNTMSYIKVELDPVSGVLSVENDGKGIPVAMHKTENVYVPEMVMGNLMSGSNFNDSELKVVGGRNGFGAKLTNIFSKHFKVETYDKSNGLRYSQSWSDNMSVRHDPIIEKVRLSSEFTRIEFKPDLEKFHLKSLVGEDIIYLMERRVYDIAGCNPDIKVSLNGTPIKYDFQSYAKLYEHHLSRSQEKNLSNPQDNLTFGQIGDRWNIGIGTSDTGQFTQVSFVNSINTLKGGSHVNFIADQVIRYIAERIKKKHPDLEVRPMNIKHHLSLFVNCLIENPSFDSQTKETLTTKPINFGSTPEVPEKMLEQFVKQSKIIDKIAGWVLMRQQAELVYQSSTRTSKSTLAKSIPKLDDANWAGGPKSRQCTLIITEGDSAKSLAVAGMSVLGRDRFGVFPLRGKLLNVRDVAPKQLLSNEEINNLTNILGLSHKRRYHDEQSLSELRYGKVLIMTDQDNDGSHIKGLFINFIHYFWPELLKADFLEEFVTPIIKVSKGADRKSFFTINDYLKWQRSLPDQSLKGWNIKYYKGLGTNTSAEAKEYFSNLKKHVIKFKWNDESDHLIGMAFNKDAADKRQQWLMAADMTQSVDHSIKELSYSDFINKELVHYSWAANHRSIPSVMDGLKPGQRKILFACFKRNLTHEIKVAQLSGYVAEHTAYHHGEQSLSSTIVKMAQDFVGSNNIPLISQGGQFGTRLMGGDDSASPRYIFTKLNQITRLIYNDLDEESLNFLEEEGESIQPSYYIPIIPMILVNGSSGIGVGMSNSVPLYSPIDLIEYLLLKLSNQRQMKKLIPWYRGFKGNIVISGKSFKTSGLIKITGRNSLSIREIPIGKWTSDYKQVLNDLIEQDIIKSFTEENTENTVNFTVSTTYEQMERLEESTENELLSLFKLTSLVHPNLTLFAPDGTVKKYESVEEIVDEFYGVRLDAYVKRRENIMKKLQQQIDKHKVTINFIQLIASGKVKIGGVSKDNVIKDLEAKGFHLEGNQQPEETFTYLFNLPILEMTQEKITTLTNLYTKKTEEFNAIQAQTADNLWKTDLLQLRDALLKDASYKREKEVVEIAPKSRKRTTKQDDVDE